MKKSFLFLPIFIIFFTGCFQEKKEVKFFGNVDVRTVSLAFRVSGRLESLNFDEGQKLKKGDIIATIENSIFKENINQINAQIKLQEIQIKKLEKGYRSEEIEKAKAKLLEVKVNLLLKHLPLQLLLIDQNILLEPDLIALNLKNQLQ